MKAPNYFVLLFIFLAIASCKEMKSDYAAEEMPASQTQEFYQLKTYTFNTDEQVHITDNYLQEAYLPGLKKLGINNIGVFKPRPNESDSVKKIHVLIPLSSMAQFLTLEEELEKDETYLAAGSNYILASHEQPPYQRIESVLLKAFVDMPMMQTPRLEGPRSERIYELRSYESPTETYFKSKVDMFNAGGEVTLFDKLEFNAVFYAEVISGSKMPNLMYMTTFSNQESRDKHWDAFSTAPEWLELKAIQKYKNSVSHADIMFLYPTEYSDY